MRIANPIDAIVRGKRMNSAEHPVEQDLSRNFAGRAELGSALSEDRNHIVMIASAWVILVARPGNLTR